MRKYTRTFHLSACHFNGEETYNLWRNILNNYNKENDIYEKNVGSNKIEPLMLIKFIELLQDMHGHDFTVTVEIILHADDDDVAMVLEDEKLESLIMKYNRRNWSVLLGLSLIAKPEGYGYEVIRATTERVAKAMCQQVAKLLKEFHSDLEYDATAHVNLSIQETRDIIVSHSEEVTI